MRKIRMEWKYSEGQTPSYSCYAALGLIASG